MRIACRSTGLSPKILRLGALRRRRVTEEEVEVRVVRAVEAEASVYAVYAV